jgi:hypothetical protein
MERYLTKKRWQIELENFQSRLAPVDIVGLGGMLRSLGQKTFKVYSFGSF